MTEGVARVRINCLSLTNFLQERLHDLAKSATLFLSMLPPYVSKFFFHEKPQAIIFIVYIFKDVLKGQISRPMRDICPAVLPFESSLPIL
jgi:hypothetical protein